MSFVHQKKEKTSHKKEKKEQKGTKKKVNWLPCQIINCEDMGFC
jgi:hypothetical protein